MGYEVIEYDIDETEYEEYAGDYEDGECPDCDGVGELRHIHPRTGEISWLECEYCDGLGFLY